MTLRLFRFHLCVALLSACAGLLVTCRPSPTPTDLGRVARWEPVEIALQAKTEAKNPFLTAFEAEITDPAGKRLTLPGFHDGGDTWTLRLMPHTPGSWTVVTRSTDRALAGHRYRFDCDATGRPHQHGRLRVDADRPHHFEFEDGTRHFAMAYECDWLWALDLGQPNIARTEAFLDRISAAGFNEVIVNSYAYDTAWRPGKTGPDDFGPPSAGPWEGSFDAPDHTRLNAAYWQHFDRMMQALHQRGLVIHLFCKVYNKQVPWPKPGSDGDALFFRTLVARYAAYPGIVWDFSKEAHNEKNPAYKKDRLRYLRTADPYGHLITNHDDDKSHDAGAFAGLVDFRTDQQHSHWRDKILRQRRKNAMPVMNAEFGYECGPDGVQDVTYSVAQTPEDFVRRAWEIAMAGGYIAYYHTYTAWDVLRPELDPPGYRLFGNLRTFFDSTRYWELVPRESAPEGQWVLENGGTEAVVWFAAPASPPFEFQAADEGRSAAWFHPFTGEKTPPQPLKAGRQTFAPPAGMSPAVLHIF